MLSQCVERSVNVECVEVLRASASSLKKNGRRRLKSTNIDLCFILPAVANSPSNLKQFVHVVHNNSKKDGKTISSCTQLYVGAMTL